MAQIQQIIRPLLHKALEIKTLFLINNVPQIRLIIILQLKHVNLVEQVNNMFLFKKNVIHTYIFQISNTKM